VTQTLPANCTCRGDLLPCAFCRGAAVPVPDRINEVVAALAQQPHITQPGAVAVVRETPAETRAQIERYNATASATRVPNGDATYLSAGIPTLIPAELQTVIAALRIELTAENNQLRNAIAAERLLHRSTQVRLAEAQARLAAFVDPDPPATPKVMPANALRHARRDGWRMLT
jgi:hypothetical protein